MMKNDGSKQPGPCDWKSSNQADNSSRKGLHALGDVMRRNIGLHEAPKRLRKLFGSDTSASATPGVGSVDGHAQDSASSGYKYTIPGIPSQNGRYQYSPLVSSQYPNAIRLVRIEPGEGIKQIRCSIIHTSLIQATRSYEALSYTWGDLGEREDIFVVPQGAKLAVTGNCMAALRLLRYPDRPVLAWIDAICINQEDILERNAQVAMMGRIYELANKVTIFLGEKSADSDLIMDFLGVFQIEDGIRETPRDEFLLSLAQKQALVGLFRRPWFSRVWILQEVFKCPFGKAVIVCGDTWIDWSALTYLKIVMDDIRDKAIFKHWHEPILWPYVLSLQSDSSFSARKSLYNFLLETRDFGSTDPRDKLFALLPLFEDACEEGLVADYALTPAQVYINVAEYLLQDGLEFLSSAQGPTTVPSLPLWVPDWSQPYKRRQLSKTSSLFNAGGPPNEAIASISRPEDQGYSATLIAQGFVLGIASPEVEYNTIPCHSNDFDIFSLILQDWNVITQTLTNRQIPKNTPVESDDLEQAVSTHQPFLYSITKTYSHPIWDRPLPVRYPRVRPKISGGRASWGNPRSPLLGDDNDYADFPAACGLVFGSRNLWQSKEPFISWEETVKGAMVGRMLLTTENGYFGLAPPEIRGGDVICILMGAPVPYALRKRGNHFVFVGECFVDGVMCGEALEMVRSHSSASEHDWEEDDTFVKRIFAVR